MNCHICEDKERLQIVEFKKQFSPGNVAFQARDAVMKLKHNGPIREYIKKFLDLASQLPDIGDADKLCHFVANLSPWQGNRSSCRSQKTSPRPSLSEDPSRCRVVKLILIKRRAKTFLMGHMQAKVGRIMLAKVGENKAMRGNSRRRDLSPTMKGTRE